MYEEITFKYFLYKEKYFQKFSDWDFSKQNKCNIIFIVTSYLQFPVNSLLYICMCIET